MKRTNNLIALTKRSDIDPFSVKGARVSRISLLVSTLTLCGASIFLVGCDRLSSSPIKTDFIEFNGDRHSITSYNIKSDFNKTLGQQSISLEFLQQKKSIGTLSLGLEGSPPRVVRAGICVIYGNGVFKHGEENGGLCVSGPSVVSAVDWDNLPDTDSPKFEFKWNGTLGKEDIPASVEFSSITVTRN